MPSDSTRVSMRQLLVRRLRSLLLVLLLAGCVFSGLELWWSGLNLPPQFYVKMVGVTLSVTALVVVGRSRAVRHAWSLALGIISVAYVLTALSGMLSPPREYATTTVLFVGAALTTATVLPWGHWPQLLTVGVAALCLGLAVLWADGNLHVGASDSGAAVLIAFALSVAMAHQVNRYRLAHRRELQVRRRREMAIRRLNTRLEQRVLDHREQEARARALFQHTPVAIWEEDFSEVKRYLDRFAEIGDFAAYLEQHPEVVRNCMKRLKLVEVNEASLAAFKARDKDELVSRLPQLTTDSSYETFRKELVAIHNGQTELQCEMQQRALDGSVRDVVFRWSVPPGHEQTLSRVLASSLDVTERKRAEEALKKAHDELERRVVERTAELSRANVVLREEVAERERVQSVLRDSEQHLRDQFAELDHLYRTAPVGLCLLDRDLRFVRINDRLAAIIGPPAADHIGRAVSELIPQQLADIVVPLCRRVLDTGEPILDREVTGTTPTEPERVGHWMLSCFPLGSLDGTAWGLSVVVQDITAQKQTEEQARRHLDQLAHVSRLSTMGEMATGIAHELNQPLATIVNLAFAARHSLPSNSSPEGNELSDMLRDLAEQALRAGEVVRRVRDFTRKAAPRRPAIDANQVIGEVLTLAAPDLRSNGVDLELKLADSLPPVSADAIQLQQVVLNLIRNALEAMADEAQGTRRLVIATSATSGDSVEVAVSDSGMGLRTENTEQVFDAFFSTKANGMGLGLAISRSIIEAHRGRLWAEANPVGGATFRFTLPLAKTDGDARA